ncbi:hypothetical protein SMZ92_000188 [Cronobacter sakazakii]|nr:hypothetical protein [Cronobacter sakazakii]
MMKNKIVHFFNGIKLSHIMCFAVGVLIPIYADVLFFHGYDSSTTSAIMDTVMAIAAIYTIVKVKDWYADKINEKGFEQANQYITLFHEAKLKAELLHLKISQLYYYNENKNINSGDLDYEKLLNNAWEFHADYRDHMLKLKSQSDILRVWNMSVHPDKKAKLNESIENLNVFTITSHNMIKICEDVSGMARKKSWEFHNISFKHNFALTQILPSEWLDSWKSLFVVAN